jgi:hypothetical protein
VRRDKVIMTECERHDNKDGTTLQV